MKHELISKALYLPEKKNLAIGDMHIGYEEFFRSIGSAIPKVQVLQTYKDLENIFKKLNSENKPVEKVILLGDIKHCFAYRKFERSLFLELLIELGKYVDRENIILIKGNHENMAEIADKQLKDYHIEDDILFIHGDINFPKVFDRDIKTVIMSHLHPAVTLIDPEKIKKEKYKCFLIGKHQNKDFFILPSFLPIVEGTSTNEYLTEGHCIIPTKDLMDFNVHAIGDDEIFDFGKLGGMVEE